MIKHKKTVITGIIIFMLIVFSGIYFISGQQIRTFKSYFDKGNYQQSYKYYNEQKDKNTFKKQNKFAKEIREYLTPKIKETEDMVTEGKIDKDKSIKILDNIKLYYINTEGINQCENRINSLNDSRVAYKNGKNELKLKKYFEAVVDLSKAIKKDINYKDAQKLIKDNSNLAKKEKIDEALNSANDALKIFPNDTDLKKMLRKLQMQNMFTKQKIINC